MAALTSFTTALFAPGAPRSLRCLSWTFCGALSSFSTWYLLLAWTLPCTLASQNATSTPQGVKKEREKKGRNKWVVNRKEMTWFWLLGGQDVLWVCCAWWFTGLFHGPFGFTHEWVDHRQLRAAGIWQKGYKSGHGILPHPVPLFGQFGS